MMNELQKVGQEEERRLEAMETRKMSEEDARSCSHQIRERWIGLLDDSPVQEKSFSSLRDPPSLRHFFRWSLARTLLRICVSLTLSQPRTHHQHFLHGVACVQQLELRVHAKARLHVFKWGLRRRCVRTTASSILMLYMCLHTGHKDSTPRQHSHEDYLRIYSSSAPST